MLNENLELALRASLHAGKVIMDIYDCRIDIEFKEDNSPVTEADRRANDIINSYLTTTSIPIISEENEQIDYSARKSWEKFWIVDPLDGTKEFLKKNGEFTVNIALIIGGIPKIGVIYIPETKTIYYSNTDEKKAYKAKLNSHKFELDKLKELSKELQPKHHISSDIKIVSSRSYMNEDTLKFAESLKNEGKNVEILSKGSSLKFCLIAEGSADIYPRFAPTMEWDTAAGHAICNAVGIRVISKKSKKPLIYNKENLQNDYFIAYTASSY